MNETEDKVFCSDGFMFCPSIKKNPKNIPTTEPWHVHVNSARILCLEDLGGGGPQCSPLCMQPCV